MVSAKTRASLKTTHGAWLWLCIFSIFQATLVDRYWFKRNLLNFQFCQTNQIWHFKIQHVLKRETNHESHSCCPPWVHEVFPSFISPTWIVKPRRLRGFQRARRALPLQKAIDELPSGAILRLPPGRYENAEPIILRRTRERNFVGFGKDQSRNQKSAVQVLSPWCWHTFLILSLFCDVVVDEKIKAWAAFQLVMSYHHTSLDISARPAYHSHCSITSNTLKRYS